MRHTLAAALLCSLALSVSAGTITSLSPSSIQVNSGEHFITVYGSDLGDRLVFDGPAGHFEVNVSATFWDSVVGWVPEAVASTAGSYELTVTGPNGTSGPAYFKVRGFRMPLILLLPEYVRVQPLTREGAYVGYEVFALGGEDPEPKISCTPESGAFFGMGESHVTCFAANRYGERAEGSFSVHVRDEEAPVLEVPREPIQVKAQSIEGAYVDYKVAAWDDIYGHLEPECLPPSGSNFPIGVTTVQCSAADFDLNIGYGSFEVHVFGEREPYPLIIEVPEEIVVEAKSPEGTEVHYDVRVTGTEDPEPRLACEPKSGSLFAIGDTIVACNAIDAWGMRGSASFRVRVLDTGFPEIVEFFASPDMLVANDELHPIEAYVRAFDDFDPAPVCEIDSVTANEEISLGDHDDPKMYDWRITGPLSVELRARRFSEMRVYTLWVGCTDFFGNRSVAATDVVVVEGRPSKAPAVVAPGKRRAVGRR